MNTRLYTSITLLLNISLFYSCSLYRKSPPVPDTLDLTIATYNILYTNPDLSKTIELIRSFNADIVCLQETTLVSQQALRDQLSDTYPFMFSYVSPINNGPTVLSRYPVRNEHYYRSSYGINGYWFGDINMHGRWIQIVNIHLQPTFLKNNPIRFAKGLRATERVRSHEIDEVCAGLSREMPLLVVGDFNSFHYFNAPHCLEKFGLRDSYDSARKRSGPSDTLYTRILGVKRGFRVDYIFHSPHFEALTCSIKPGRPSDHNPVVTTFAWNPEFINLYATENN